MSVEDILQAHAERMKGVYEKSADETGQVARKLKRVIGIPRLLLGVERYREFLEEGEEEEVTGAQTTIA